MTAAGEVVMFSNPSGDAHGPSLIKPRHRLGSVMGAGLYVTLNVILEPVMLIKVEQVGSVQKEAVPTKYEVPHDGRPAVTYSARAGGHIYAGSGANLVSGDLAQANGHCSHFVVERLPDGMIHQVRLV